MARSHRAPSPDRAATRAPARSPAPASTPGGTAASGRPLKALGIFALAALVGAAAGLGGVGFRALTDWMQLQLTGKSGEIAENAEHLPTLQRLLIPTIGGLLAGFCLVLVRKRAHFGVADTMELVLTRKGQIHPRRSLIQILASAFSISSGASLGREAANSQIGATVGSMLSALVRGTSRTRAVLLGCGIAAGMAHSYKAPIAGGMFVMEVVLGNFAMDVFAPIVVASVVSSLVTRAFYYPDPIYPSDAVLGDWRLVVAAGLLGVVCAAGSLVLRRGLTFGKTLFGRLPGPPPLHLALGGLAVGAIGVWWPQVWGNGFHALKLMIYETPVERVIFFILLWKIVATALSLGSGALGGTFTPTLVVGAALGAFFGQFVHFLAPHMGDNRVAFALVGAAGLTAANTHAPITAIILIFELTLDYELILPLMLCSIVASVVARMFDEDSIYSARLRAHATALSAGIEELAIQRNYVRDVMRRDPVKVPDTATFDEVMELFGRTRRDTVYVVDKDGGLLGRINIHDVKYFINDPTLGSVVIAADLTRSAPTATRDESLAHILPRFDDADLDELAVVADGATSRLEGRITRRDVIALFSEEVLGQRTLRTKIHTAGKKETTWLELPQGTDLALVPVPDALVGRAIDSLDLRGSVGLQVLMVVERTPEGIEQRVLAEPQLVLREGASLIVLGPRDAIEAFRKHPGGPPPA